jgi:hypothetical protein
MNCSFAKTLSVVAGVKRTLTAGNQTLQLWGPASKVSRMQIRDCNAVLITEVSEQVSNTLTRHLEVTV